MDDVEVVARLYEALAARGGEAMAALYAPEAHFSDPVFTDLRGPEVGAMWRMLCARAQDLRVEVRDLGERDGAVEARWEASYTFAATGRPVLNAIQSRIVLEDGLIVRQVDTFDFHRWAAQAFGRKGKALGWTKPFHAAVSRKARAGLERFMADAGA